MNQAQARIKAVFEALNTTANAFALTHGFNVPTMYGFVNGQRSPGFDTLVNICQAEPRISAEFLLRGEGQPLRDHQLTTSSSTVDQLKALRQDFLHTIDKRIQELGGAY